MLSNGCDPVLEEPDVAEPLAADPLVEDGAEGLPMGLVIDTLLFITALTNIKH
jgi:hypothetical protein